MGNARSRNAEVIIAQNGANDARNTSNLERKLEIYSVFTVIIVAVLIVTCVLIGCKLCGRRVKKVLVKDIVSALEKGQSQPAPAKQTPTQPAQHSY